MKDHKEQVIYNGYEIRLSKKDNFTDAYYMTIYKDNEYCMGIRGAIPYDRCMETAKQYIDVQNSLYTESGIKIKPASNKNSIFESFKSIYESDIIDENINDPVLMAIRAAKMSREKSQKEEEKRRKKRVYGKKRDELEWELIEVLNELKDLYKDKSALFVDMEEEAGQKGDEWTDDDANYYGEKLNTIDEEITKLIKRRNEIEILLNY